MRFVFLFILVALFGCDKHSKQTESYPKDLTPQTRYEWAINKLQSSSSRLERFHALTNIVIPSFEIGKIDESQNYADELLKLASLHRSNWNYGNAIHKGNIVLGRIAVRNNEIELAKVFLLKAGDIKGSPQLNSFGPNMTLAKELLEKSETNVVVKYLETCKKFWESGQDKLDFWIFQIHKGKTPEFGANLFY